jgi:hypothetical protein
MAYEAHLKSKNQLRRGNQQGVEEDQDGAGASDNCCSFALTISLHSHGNGDTKIMIDG